MLLPNTPYPSPLPFPLGKSGKVSNLLAHDLLDSTLRIYRGLGLAIGACCLSVAQYFCPCSILEFTKYFLTTSKFTFSK